MDYEGFKLFMSAYLGDNVSEDLCQHLFWAFHKQVAVHSPSLSQTIIDSVAATVVSNSQQDVNKYEQRRRKFTLVDMDSCQAPHPKKVVVMNTAFAIAKFSKV